MKYINSFVPQSQQQSFAVLLINLGTPDAPNTSAVRKYLRQFLSDTRVIEFPKFIWWFILNFIILVTRPRRSAAAYKEVWQDEGSPLMTITKKQAVALKSHFESKGMTNIAVRYAMRYGNPSIAEVIDELAGIGISKLAVIPMYPQYSASTAGSVFDGIGSVLSKRRYVPSIRFVNQYSDRDDYIQSLQISVREHWLANGKGDRLVMSFHGLPKEMVDKGDPYREQCVDTAQRLAAALELGDDEWALCFQSRFGPKEWLQPYADDVLSNLPEQGVKSINMMCPGFSADCLETLEEVNMGYRELFLSSGGESFTFIPCLNDRPEHIEMLANMIVEMTADW